MPFTKVVGLGEQKPDSKSHNLNPGIPVTRLGWRALRCRTQRPTRDDRAPLCRRSGRCQIPCRQNDWNPMNLSRFSLSALLCSVVCWISQPNALAQAPFHGGQHSDRRYLRRHHGRRPERVGDQHLRHVPLLPARLGRYLQWQRHRMVHGLPDQLGRLVFLPAAVLASGQPTGDLRWQTHDRLQDPGLRHRSDGPRTTPRIVLRLRRLTRTTGARRRLPG